MEELDFRNTQLAFQYKNNFILIRDYYIFRLMEYQGLVNRGIKVVDRLVKNGLTWPIALGAKPTVFSLFVGGDSLEDAKRRIEKLNRYGVESILDYGVEGKKTEVEFELTVRAIRESIVFASTHQGARIVCSKFTSLVPMVILEKLHEGIELSPKEATQWNRCMERIEGIAELAYQNHISLFVDAEESWIQKSLNDITLNLMRKYNKVEPIIYNTIQLYLKSRLEEFKSFVELAEKEGFIYGVKLVRGAYMEKERAYAFRLGIEDPIQNTKEDTDKAYDEAVSYALHHIKNTSVCIATHNEESTLKAAELSQSLDLSKTHPHLHFAQLLGMSDHITFNLAKAGYQVAKYLPYGPVRDVLPYLIRRAQENTSVSGQLGRELELHKIEMKRRHLLIF